jgi:ribosomal protein S18 acetylase RimI-like enzyme
MEFDVRRSTVLDKQSLYILYQKVARYNGGIARTEQEITENYISNNLNQSLENGMSLVVEHPDNKSLIIAEIHCYKPEPKLFSHVLSDLTIIVDQGFQRKGIGQLIFRSLLDEIESSRNDVLRVELIARESNQKAIAFYQKLGFKIEGRFESRVDCGNNQFEADIPMAWFNKNYSKAK